MQISKRPGLRTAWVAGLGAAILNQVPSALAEPPEHGSFNNSVTSEPMTSPDPTNGRPIELEAAMKFKGKSVDDENQSGRIAGLGAGVRFKDQMDGGLVLFLDGGVTFETGAYESHFANEYKPSNRISLNEASLGWKPFASTLVKVGALDQSFHDSPLLNDSDAFPGVIENWKSGGGPVSFELTAEQAAPTTNTTTTLPTANESLPFYDAEQVKLIAEMGRAATFSGGVTHFAYHNLTRATANDSRLLGNWVDGDGLPGAAFLYDYDGFNWGGKLTFNPYGRIQPKIGGNFLINMKAPDGQNRGYHGYLEADLLADPNTTVTPSVNVFRNERDSSVAYYNSVDWGHNNRVGMALGLKTEFRKSKLTLEGSYVRTKLIESDPYQSDFNGVFFSLRKAYELL